MFGLFRLVFTVAVIAAIWHVLRYFQRLGQAQARREAAAGQAPGRSAASAGPGRGRTARAQAIEAEDLVPCRACGSYVALKGATSCGRTDCPYPS